MKQGFVRVMAGVLLFLAGCATTPPAPVSVEGMPRVEGPPAAPAAPAVPAAKPAPPRPLADRDLLLEGVAALGQLTPDPAAARRAFAALVEAHPQSRWRATAEGLIRLIDEGERNRTALRLEQQQREKAQAERARALQENDQLKRSVRELTERLQSETAGRTQEIEQLRQDLQRLKALEVELQKRERMLR